ncbi:MAG: hypothetical protein QW756_06345 [Nitrososphaerota archaeon]
MRLNPVVVMVPVLLLITATPLLSGQMTDPCIGADRKFDLQAGVPPIEGVLAKRLEDHFYRFEGIRPGQRITVNVEVSANISTAISMILLREAQPKSFARIAGEQLIVGREKTTATFSWMEASPEWGQPALCFKVGQFSEARPVESNYKILVTLEDTSDYGGGDAPGKPERAVDLGSLSAETPATIAGYLSSSSGGNDHTDFYTFSASLTRGDKIIVEVSSTPENSVLDIAILDRDIFGLKSNKTTNGRAELSLPWEKTETQSFYLKFSNNGGVGGEARYTATISIRKTTAAQTAETTQQEQPTMEPTTARMIVFGGVTFVAAVSVIALLIRLREPRVREITPEEWEV